MNVLDENVRADQRELLRDRRIPVRHIGHDIVSKGIQDDNIIPLLLRLRRPTFFTCDSDFYQRRLCHPRYCLVYLAIDDLSVAVYVRRVLRHPSFNTEAKRMGTVIRASSSGLTVWRLHAGQQETASWPE